MVICYPYLTGNKSEPVGWYMRIHHQSKHDQMSRSSERCCLPFWFCNWKFLLLQLEGFYIYRSLSPSCPTCIHWPTQSWGSFPSSLKASAFQTHHTALLMERTPAEKAILEAAFSCCIFTVLGYVGTMQRSTQLEEWMVLREEAESCQWQSFIWFLYHLQTEMQHMWKKYRNYNYLQSSILVAKAPAQLSSHSPVF